MFWVYLKNQRNLGEMDAAHMGRIMKLVNDNQNTLINWLLSSDSSKTQWEQRRLFN